MYELVKKYLLILFFFLFSIQLNAQNRGSSVLSLQKIESQITLDGVLDDPAWETVAPFPLVMYQPVHRGNMTQKSEIKVVYDSEYIYVSGALYDSEPEKMMINSMYRDRYSSDETFAIILDTFNDDENAKWFFVTPTGVRVDQLVLNDSEGENSFNRDWNTWWDAATQVTDEGWFVEMRIPFSSLGYRKTDEGVMMGMIVYRYIARNAERHIFPDIPPVFSRGFTKPSQAQKVRMEGIDAKTPLFITPYFLGGFERLQTLNSSGTGYSPSDDYVTEAGLDIRYPVTGNMNLDLTLNTDFAQVEADDAQVNLSRFPLFFPEKRQFFQERSDIFDFDLGGNNTLFYSRRIGLNQGEQVRILGGARLSGSAGKWDVGMLNMQTDALSTQDLSAENFGVLRARRKVINRNSYAGGMVTTRLGSTGNYNVGAGADFLWNITGNEYLDVKYAITLDDQYDGSLDPGSNSIARINLTRRSVQGFTYDLTAKRAGEQFQPEMGFESRRDFTLIDTRLNYGLFASEESAFRIITPGIRHFVSFRNFDRSMESMLFEHEWEFDFKDGAEAGVTATYWYEDLQNTLFFSDDVFVPVGEYGFFGIELEYGMNRAHALRADFSAQANTFYDGSQYSFSISPIWNPSRHLEISGEADFNLLEFEERNQKEFLNIYRLRSLIALNNQVSLQVLSQYNHLAKKIGTNARFRINFREGNDLWIVFNETSNINLNRFTPTLPKYDNRTLLIKYTYTFF